MEITQYLVQQKRQIDDTLNRYLPKGKDVLSQAMRYSFFPGGKRLRPILTLATVELLGGDVKRSVLPACAIELIHTFTLIHDDLPCMDNSDYRRGKLSSHKVYGEAIAVLAGDALLNFAFKLIAKSYSDGNIDSEPLIKIINTVCDAMGTNGVAGGQAKEMYFRGRKINKTTLEDIYKRKTAALICASLKIGAILGKATKQEFSSLVRYGENIGFAFQLTDDIIEATRGELETKKDEPNYLYLSSLKETRDIARHRIIDAKKNLAIFGQRARTLCQIADYILSRKA